MAESSEHKTVQAHVLQYAQEIGWTSVTCAEAEQQLGFALYPYTLPGNGAKEMMEQQLVAAQIQVHDLDVDDLCSNLLQKLVVLCDVTGMAPRPRPRGNSGAGCAGNSFTTCARIWQQAVAKFSKGFRGL